MNLEVKKSISVAESLGAELVFYTDDSAILKYEVSEISRQRKKYILKENFRKHIREIIKYVFEEYSGGIKIYIYLK